MRQTLFNIQQQYKKKENHQSQTLFHDSLSAGGHPMPLND
jgi:hypothetical protein